MCGYIVVHTRRFYRWKRSKTPQKQRDRERTWQKRMDIWDPLQYVHIHKSLHVSAGQAVTHHCFAHPLVELQVNHAHHVPTRFSFVKALRSRWLLTLAYNCFDRLLRADSRYRKIVSFKELEQSRAGDVRGISQRPKVVLEHVHDSWPQL